jgi:hypothetical protein
LFYNNKIEELDSTSFNYSKIRFWYNLKIDSILL